MTTATEELTSTTQASTSPATTTWPAGADVGNKVAVSTIDGAFEGRVHSITNDMMRLRWGAGMWNISRSDLIAVDVTSTTPPARIAPTAEQNRAQARRILARWP